MTTNLTRLALDARAEQPPLTIVVVLVLEAPDVALLRDALQQLPRRTARRAQLLARLHAPARRPSSEAERAYA